MSAAGTPVTKLDCRAFDSHSPHAPFGNYQRRTTYRDPSVWARSKIRAVLYKRFFVSEEMRKTSLPSRNLCISTLVSWLSTLPRHTGKCLTWILLLPRHPTWILHLPRRRRGSFIFLVTQEVHNVDNTYILVANVDSIVSSSHRNCTTWIFKHPRSSSWILKVPRHTEIS